MSKCGCVYEATGKAIWSNMADSKRDYYEVLGLQKGAGDNEIKKAYELKERTVYSFEYTIDNISKRLLIKSLCFVQTFWHIVVHFW